MTTIPAYLFASVLHSCREVSKTSRPSGHYLPEFATALGAVRHVCSELRLKLPAKPVSLTAAPEYGSEIIRWNANSGKCVKPDWRFSFTKISKGSNGEWHPTGAIGAVEVDATVHTHVNNTFFSNEDITHANSREIMIFLVIHSGTYFYHGKDGSTGTLSGDHKRFVEWLASG